jgi:hypothetical protein
MHNRNQDVNSAHYYNPWSCPNVSYKIENAIWTKNRVYLPKM